MREESICRRETVVPGVDAVYYYDGPDFGVGYMVRGEYRHVDNISSQHEAEREVDQMVRYGREYAHFPRTKD